MADRFSTRSAVFFSWFVWAFSVACAVLGILFL